MSCTLLETNKFTYLLATNSYLHVRAQSKEYYQSSFEPCGVA